MLRLLELHCLLEFPELPARKFPALRAPASRRRASEESTDSGVVAIAASVEQADWACAGLSVI